ncbi:MAG: hypothetical protein ACI9EF_001395 [Pseudohongiellaceae bacterium]
MASRVLRARLHTCDALVRRSLDDVAKALGPPNGSRLLPLPEWQLEVDCTRGMLSFDRLVYWPSETYPRSMHGGRSQRIGDWAYVDE